MNILDAITKILGLAIPNVPNVKALLLLIETKLPDLKPELDPIIKALDAPLDIAQLANQLPPEVWEILKGHINSREHPGDAI
ncbi:MAG TPA: hypothetical protein VNN79_12635 [Actinomycetota bacterium]|nr:hypothetical protein [Actinomycetota bacterium]